MKSGKFWRFFLVSISLGLIYFSYVAIQQVSKTPDVWVIIAVALFIGALVPLALLFAEPERQGSGVLLILTIVIGFWLGNAVLEWSGRNFLNIVESKLLRNFEYSRSVIIAPPIPNKEAGKLKSVESAQYYPASPIYLKTGAEIGNALRSKGIDAYQASAIFPLLPAIEQGENDGFLPLSGHSRAVTLYCNEGDQHEWPAYRSDRYGFNNDDLVYASDLEKVMIVGDSFAHGACVHQEQSVAGVLRRNGYGSISIGIGGHGPLLMLASLMEYGPALKPPAVLWFHFDGNDITDLRDREMFLGYLQQYLTGKFLQKLASRQGEVDKFWEDVQKIPGHKLASIDWKKRLEQLKIENNDKSLAFYRAFLGDSKIESLDDDATLVKLFAKIISTARDRVAEWGGHFYFVIIPNMDDYRGRIPPYRRPVMDAVSNLGIPIIDVDRALRAQSSGDMFQFYPTRDGYGHLNAFGYQIMSAEIMRYLNVERNYPVTPFINIKKAEITNECVSSDRTHPLIGQRVLSKCNGKMNCALTSSDFQPAGKIDECSTSLEIQWTCNTKSEVNKKSLKLSSNEGKLTIGCAMP